MTQKVQKKKSKTKHSLNPEEEATRVVERKAKKVKNKQDKRAKKDQEKCDEATTYLQEWQKQKKGEANSWKYKKNLNQKLTEWMYDPVLIPKHLFSILLDYIKDDKSQDHIKRVVKRARQKCIRYKEYEKNKSQEEADDEEDKQDDQDDDNEAGAKGAAGSTIAWASTDDEWKKLSDKDKRKEYKRARKVVEVLDTGKASETS